MLAPFSRLWAEPVLDSALRSEGLGSADRQRMQSTRRELSEREVTSLGPSFDLLPSAPARVQPPELSPRPRLLWRKRAPHPSHRSYPGSWVKVGRPSCFGEVTAAFSRLHRRQSLRKRSSPARAAPAPLQPAPSLQVRELWAVAGRAALRKGRPRWLNAGVWRRDSRLRAGGLDRVFHWVARERGCPAKTSSSSAKQCGTRERGRTSITHDRVGTL